MKYNRVLLISLDSLGSKYQRRFEPYFNVSYRNYRTTHRWTLPSHVAMLSGAYLPELYHVFDVKQLQKWKGYVKNIPTLATVFRRLGFKTKAITSGGYLSRFFGWGHDWDEWQTPEEGFAEWNGEKVLPEKGELLFYTRTLCITGFRNLRNSEIYLKEIPDYTISIKNTTPRLSKRLKRFMKRG